MGRSAPSSLRLRPLPLVAMQLVISIGLTLLMIDEASSYEAVIDVFTVNLVYTVAISWVAAAVFDVVLPRLRWSAGALASAHVAGLAISLAIGIGLASRILSGLGLPHGADGMSVWRVAAVVTCVALLVGFGFDRLRDHARAVELREEQARREVVQAQLQALRDRLNPHFLFNSLNALAGLIEEDPALAVEALERLSALLRRALEQDAARKISLIEELAVLRDYLGLAKLRFGDRLRWSIDADETALQARIPAFLLQPVVENAVKYAVAPRRFGATIQVTAKVSNDRLYLHVRDDGDSTEVGAGTKLGHKTLIDRLALDYGDRASVTAGPLPGVGYAVDVELPLEVQPS